MSMSTYVVGFRPPDDRWEKMKAVWDACAEAGIELPREVEEFFDGEEPDAAGVEVDMIGLSACTRWRAEMRAGYEIDLAKVPSNIKIIRFYNSW